MARFAFRFHPLYRVLGLPFGVTSGTSVVEVVDDHLVGRFGPWYLRTPVTNVFGCDHSGSYPIWRTAVFERTYRVRIADSTQSPEELLAFVTSNFKRATPVQVAEITER